MPICSQVWSQLLREVATRNHMFNSGRREWFLASSLPGLSSTIARGLISCFCSEHYAQLSFSRKKNFHVLTLNTEPCHTIASIEALSTRPQHLHPNKLLSPLSFWKSTNRDITFLLLFGHSRPTDVALTSADPNRPAGAQNLPFYCGIYLHCKICGTSMLAMSPSCSTSQNYCSFTSLLTQSLLDLYGFLIYCDLTTLFIPFWQQ